MRDAAKTTETGQTLASAGGKRTAGRSASTAGDAMKEGLRGKTFEAGADMLRPKGPTRIAVDVPASLAWGGYLRPSFVATVTASADPEWQGEPGSEAKRDDALRRALPGAVAKEGAMCVASPSMPLPAAAAIEDTVERGVMFFDGKRWEGWRIAVGAVETKGWQLDASGATTWDDLDVNPTRAPNMEVDIGGSRVALEVSGTATIKPRAEVGRFDSDARDGIGSWLEVALRSTLYPMLAEGKGVADHDVAAVTTGLVARVGGLLARERVGLGGINYAVTQRGKPFVPPEAKLATAQAQLGGDKGSASFIGSADRKELANERDFPVGYEEVEHPSPEVIARMEQGDRHGDFTRALMAMLKKHPELSITEASERLIREHDLPSQTPEMFKVGDDAPADDEVGKGTRDDQRKKHALVVGCAAYASFSQLPGAANDGRAMAAVLAARGFEVDHREDIGAAAFTDALVALGKRVGPGEHCVIYFAGHGSRPGAALGEGIVGCDGKVVPHALLVRAVAHLKSQDVDVELVLDVCHAGMVTDLGESSFLGGAHNKDMTRLERQLFEIHMICKRDYEHVFDYLVGARKTNASNASGALASGQGTFDNEQVVSALLPRLEACAAQFREATGKPLVAPARLVLGYEQRTKALFAALQDAHGTSQAAWYEAARAKRTE